MAKKEVQKAFVYSYEESAKTLLDNYLDNVEAYCNWTKIKRPDHRRGIRSGRAADALDRGADRHFRERQEGVPRRDPDPHLRLCAQRQKFDYNSHERLREAIEKKLFADLKDVVKITTSTKTPDENQLKRINEVTAAPDRRTRLLSRFAPTSCCGMWGACSTGEGAHPEARALHAIRRDDAEKAIRRAADRYGG